MLTGSISLASPNLRALMTLTVNLNPSLDSFDARTCLCGFHIICLDFLMALGIYNRLLTANCGFVAFVLEFWTLVLLAVFDSALV
jgi:hypothetical protein